MRLSLNSLSDETWDVVVIGAGAVGCASARELAGRGFRTLLLDRGDIGSGTSSRSSRMLYSGVGYLAPDFPLWQMPFRALSVWQRFLYARTIMHCRAELVSDMPQRLARHRFHYPFRKDDRYPPWLIDAGFRMMDTLASRGVSLAYRRLSPQEAAQQSPMVSGLDGSISSVAVFDEYMYDWPERICVDTALDAECRGATLRTYARASQIRREADLWHITVDEQVPGQSGQAGIRTRALVNAAGPWVDRLPGSSSGANRRVIGKKGVNVMIRLPDAWRGQGLEAFSSKGEPFYVFPWRDLHFIGPTETLVNEDPDDIRVLDSEIDYILGEANFVFPKLGLKRSDVLHAWCGVRPMSTMDGKTVSLPVRAIEDARMPGLVTVTGSYIMMHRHAARLAAAAVERHLGSRNPAPRGMLVQPRPTSNDPEIAALAVAEHVVRLSDLLRRRLPDGLNESLGLDRAEHLSRVAASALGWTEAHRQQEVQQFKEETESVFQRH